MTTTPLEVQVFNTSLTSLAANMVLLKGETEALLIDTPFSRADGYRMAAEILDSGRTLKTIFVTHDHPDHFFTLDVMADAFPQATPVAHDVVAKDLTRSIPIKFERWSPMLGVNAPHRQVFPTALDGDEIVVDGHTLKVLGPMQGDHVHCTAIWDPETKILVAGDLVFNGVFPWLGEHLEPQYQSWLESLDRIEALHPARIVAGHTKPGVTDDSGAIAWTRGYIQAFRKAAKEAKNSAELASTMYGLYPDAIDVAGGFLVGVSSQVGTGEIPPWDE